MFHIVPHCLNRGIRDTFFILLLIVFFHTNLVRIDNQILAPCRQNRLRGRPGTPIRGELQQNMLQNVESELGDSLFKKSHPCYCLKLIVLRMKHSIAAPMRLPGNDGKKCSESERLIAVMNTLFPLGFTLIRPKVLTPNRS